MSAAARARATRRSAGLFRLATRGLVEVTGSDRTRWLDGMASNDVGALAPGPERSGCYAMFLDRKGRIVADAHVLLRPDRFWLDLEGSAAAAVCAHLERFIIADDVAVRDASADFARFAVEGPAAGAVVAGVLPDLPELAPDACADATLAGVPVTVAAFGWSGESGFQFYGPSAAVDTLAEALRRAVPPEGVADGDADTLEVLRIEAGIPRQGAELGLDVLPAEAGLDRAISTTKGCYTGQEVVTRLRNLGQVKHHMIGLRFEAGAAPASGQTRRVGDDAVGEVTSVCFSAEAGVIALGFARRPHHETGTELRVDGEPARVTALPFVAPGRSGAG